MGFQSVRGSGVAEIRTDDALAEAAVAEIEPGMVVGLGTGRTAERVILALSRRVHEQGLLVHCVPTSHVTETLARSQRLNVLDFALVEKIDYLFDGADEVDQQFRMLKGLQGAVARQRRRDRRASSSCGSGSAASVTSILLASSGGLARGTSSISGSVSWRLIAGLPIRRPA